MAATQQMPDTKERNAFITACADNDIDAVRRTLAAHPDAVHWQHDKSGETGLMARAGQGSEDCRIAVLLLEAGADVNAATPGHGMTALMIALLGRNGSEAHVALLLDHGADYKTLRNHEDKTAEEIARFIARPEMATEFDKFHTRKAQAMADAAQKEIEEMAQDISRLQRGSEAPVPVRKKPLKLQPKI